MPTPRWPWWHQPYGPDAYRTRELLRAIWDLHAVASAQTWLWRGQPNFGHDLTPAVHTRVATGGLTDDRVVACTNSLLTAAQVADLNRHEDAILPDLALLAMLQHHGAATPLLDVSLDPIVGLYMAIVSPDPEDDERDGVVFAIRRPSITVAAFTSKNFADVYESLPADGTVFYSAPDVSERLRIQRGHFLLGRVADRLRTSMPLEIEPTGDGRVLADNWIYKLLNARGQRGQHSITSDVAVFRVTAKFKGALRLWLEERTGLTSSFVLPTAWHRPHLDAFCSAHGRVATWL